MDHKLTLSNFMACFLLSCLVLSSCKNVTNENTCIINMDTNEFIDIDIEKILENSSFTPLEFNPEAALSGIIWFLPYGEAFYVIDRRQKKLLHFDLQGRFVRKIGDVGQGPNEYVALRDVHVSNNGYSFLTGTSQTRIIDYNNGGVLVKTTTYLEESSSSFGVHPQSGDFFFTGWEHLKPRIIKVDPVSRSVIDTFLTVNGFAHSDMGHNFSISNTQNLLCFTSMDNQIYEITQDTVRTKYKLDYRLGYPDYSDIEKTSWKDLDTYGFWLIHRILENRNWMFLCISRGSNTQDDLQEGYNLVYNKTTGDVFRLPGRWQDQDDFDPAFYLGDRNTLYISMVPVKILDDPTWINFFKRLGNIPDENSNPIILKIPLDKITR